MKNINNQLKKQLDKELEHIQFSSQQDVINRIYPVTWKQKFHRLWNKEITIPLIPVSTVCLLFLIVIGLNKFNSVEQHQYVNHEKELIEVAGNYYWKDDLERALLKHED